MKKKINKIASWNFGPRSSNFVNVMKIVKMIDEAYNFKRKIQKKNYYSETNVLKLDSRKSKNILNWKSKWNIKKTIEKVIEWKILESKRISARKICELQVKDYLRD